MNIRALLTSALSILIVLPGNDAHGDEIEIIDGEGGFVEGAIIGRASTVAKAKDKQAPHPDAAGEQVLELTDGSQLHGRLVTLGKSELVWQRGDTTVPLIFAPSEVRRIVLDSKPGPSAPKSNATLKLPGNGWLAGDLTGFANGKFRLNLGEAPGIEIERSKVEWLYLSPSLPPDTYEGPDGPMGLSGWDTGGGAWDYTDGALVARTASPLTRQFSVLPDKVDIRFTTNDGGEAARGLTLWLQPGRQTRGYSKGSVYLRFQGNNVTANSYDGQNMKNFSANMAQDKNPAKVTHYRILHNRRTGKFFLFANGKRVADWDLTPIKDPEPGGALSWQPTYWSSTMAWTLSNVRVQPWDGNADADPGADDAGKDLLSTGTAARQAGTLETVTKDSLQFAGKTIPLKEAHFVRLAATKSASEEQNPVVARVWLSQRGEFDVAALGFRDGQLKVRTSFSGDVTLPVSSIGAIEFPHRLSAAERAAAEGGDTLAFRNGDQLRGTLVGAAHDRNVTWKPVKGDRNVEFPVNRIAAVLLGQKPGKAATAGGTAVRFRNGDWLTGELRKLDKEHLMLKSALADNLQVDRASIQTLYFGPSGEVPVWDASADREQWMKGASAGMAFGGRRPASQKARINPWQYMDGTFTLNRNGGRSISGNGTNLGRVLDNLPEKVEVAFELSTSKGPAGYSVQLFTDENRPGLMIQGGWDSAYIYDMSPRKQAGGILNQPQQVDFGETVGSEGNRRHFRFLADRKTGRMVMLVNGIPMTQFGQRPGKESAKPGKGIAIIPQPMNSTIAISNVWVAPWCGAFPEVPKREARVRRNNVLQRGAVPAAPDETPAKPAAKEPRAPEPVPSSAEMVALANGDEAFGAVESATATEIRLTCDAGVLDVPLKRTVMVRFAGSPSPAEEGIRLRLADKGLLTVKSFMLSEGKILCRSTTAGELSIPIGAISELVFQPGNQLPPQAASGGEPANDTNPAIINGRVIIRGGGVLQLNGGQIIVE